MNTMRLIAKCAEILFGVMILITLFILLVWGMPSQRSAEADWIAVQIEH